MKSLSRFRRAAAASTLLAVVALTPPIHAESLWEQRVPSRSFLFYTTNAQHKGDQVTVLIDDITGVDNKEDRALSKESTATASSDTKVAAAGDLGSAAGTASLNFSSDSDRTFDGAASFSSQREFSSRVAATVTEVLPNGNLVIEGRKNVVIAGDERILVISGVVRPYDISPGNTVASRNVAQLRITYDGVGQEQSFVRQGFFSKVMNKIWPF